MEEASRVHDPQIIHPWGTQSLTHRVDEHRAENLVTQQDPGHISRRDRKISIVRPVRDIATPQAAAEPPQRTLEDAAFP